MLLNMRGPKEYVQICLLFCFLSLKQSSFETINTLFIWLQEMSLFLIYLYFRILESYFS